MLEMEGGEDSVREKFAADDFTRTVLSWSLDDIYDENLYKYQVGRIQERFNSVSHYLRSFEYPLLEETRGAICSSIKDIGKLPYAEVSDVRETKPMGEGFYHVRVDQWRNRFHDRGNEPYSTSPGDLLILVDAKPETESDLQRSGFSWRFASVARMTYGDFGCDDGDLTSTSLSFKVIVTKGAEVAKGMHKQMFVIFVENLTTEKRIWNALHMSKNWNILEKVRSPDSLGDKDSNHCLVPMADVSLEKLNLSQTLFEDLDESQVNAVRVCLLKSQNQNESMVELIWGPPGTGKTKTTSRLLFCLLKMNRRCLICAPTNVAVREVASRVFQLLRCYSSENYGEEAPLCGLGDIIVFGSKERLNVDDSDLENIYLDYRVEKLAECLAPLSGWQHHITSMIDFLNGAVSQYHLFVQNEFRRNDCESDNAGLSVEKSFLEFVKERFKSIMVPLLSCLSDLSTHISRSYLSESSFSKIITVLNLLKTFDVALHGENLSSLSVEDVFSCKPLKTWLGPLESLHLKRRECLAALVSVHDSLSKINFPDKLSEHSIKEFCLQSALLIFCTASSAFKLHYVKMQPIDVLVIDEAAQLKECESIIPLQLPQIRHIILVGDERQLPAMVESKVCNEAGFGRSLFQRLSSLGHFKHLLDTQYRMHPSISLFPNRTFYAGQIKDALIVKRESYLRSYLPLPMFGPYSFLNISDGREEREGGGTSWRNLAEVVVVLQILKNLYKAWTVSGKELSIGVISPYAGQVGEIRSRLPQKYQTEDGFVVKVQTVDGFQGGEMDIIIISSVRSNPHGSIGFLSNPNRINVALTRARYCMWILGNGKTLIGSNSLWRSLVYDAMDRQCFFNAHDDIDMGKAIFEVKKEYDQLEDLLNGSSSLFRNVRWKVIFSDNFRKAFGKLTSRRVKVSIMNMLLRLSCGWRPKRINVDVTCESSGQIVKQLKVEDLYVLCTIDIEKELNYVQVLKIWDVLPQDEIDKLVKRLDSIYHSFSDDYISRCKEKSLEGDLEVPKAWDASFDFNRHRKLNENSEGDDQRNGTADGTSYAENTKVSESLLLMKFYSLSTGTVNHLLSDHEGKEMELPFEVTAEQEEIIKFQRSSFILGRSGTGKTTILTTKLFKKEQQFHIARNESDVLSHPTKRIHRREDVDELDEDSNGPVLKQLFVTVSSKLCFAVKQQVCQLKSFVCGGKASADNYSGDVEFIGCTDQFKDIPDSFVGVSKSLYPLVVTFQKFLMMLDGSIGVTYFERFSELRDIYRGKSESAKSLALQTFVRAKEVKYDKFYTAYWPHFNEKLTRKLDPSRVFTEIISHIKGGIQLGEVCDGRLSRSEYVALAEGRSSTLTMEEREKVYDIFQDYEQMKAVNGEFDLSDLVNDLHSRLQSEKFSGDAIDFVYIDEVQDLTMRQIALFKYICKNVDEGYVFAGDTAQTIARGIDFRFEDIRCLFYKEFLQEFDYFREKGRLSKLFCLSQNFRTHAGVLKLAQSIVNLLSHFFPSLVDALSPETSLICGEAPIFLESGNDENAIVSIFGNSSSISGNVVGFGAEQVILVRDEHAREEVLNLVGKQALVLTIVECKGLEFQDVLLYNFFGTSPLKNQWRVIYEYMNKQDLFDDNIPEAYPHFDLAKHNIMCSELKQLYVAITRTRQRLWICENMEGFSKPMFDYWKKLCLIQVRKLDSYLAEAMKVASTPEEWKMQGYKLLREANYEMATMCFERAGFAYGEQLAKAFGLNAAADQMHVLNHDEACLFRKQAAEIFESIGMGESAAKCFYTLGEYERAGTIFESIGMSEAAAECFYLLKQYERAGTIYMEECGVSALKRAGECFILAGSYDQAAEVYAKGQLFSECLSVCAKGKLFEQGLQYIECWKGQKEKHGQKNSFSNINKNEQEYLENCARHYHENGDHDTMMKFVDAISSVDATRNLLKRLGCLDELLSLEEELGNFVEAANVAKMKADILTESYMLGKGGMYKDASKSILSYVLFNSLWGGGCKGWPLKYFKVKEELLVKAESYAMLVAEQSFSLYVGSESVILLGSASRLSEVQALLQVSRAVGNLRGEILCTWTLLDMHLSTDFSKIYFEDYLIYDPKEYTEERISQNSVSVETLVHSWALWRDKIVLVIQNLARLEMNEHDSYAEFCLSYLGVLKLYNTNSEPVYSVLSPDADWVRNVGIRRDGGEILLDVHQLVLAAQRYWGSELIKFGMKVLQILNAFDNSLRSSNLPTDRSEFCRCKLLTHLFEVATFLLDSKFLTIPWNEKSRLLNMISDLPIRYFEQMCPLDWRKSLQADMIRLRGSDVSCAILQEAINNLLVPKSKPSYELVGHIAVMIFGSRKLLSRGSYPEISKYFEAYPLWMKAVQCLYSISFPQGSSQDINAISIQQLVLIRRLNEALKETFSVNWRKTNNYISPVCFLYLLERLLILSCFSSSECVFTAKSGFFEWLINSDNHNNVAVLDCAKEAVDPVFKFISYVLRHLLFNPGETIDWIVKSGIKESDHYHCLIVLKLVLLSYVLALSFSESWDLVVDLLCKQWICDKLPRPFLQILKKGLRKRPKGDLKFIAEAFKEANDPLMIVVTNSDASSLCNPAVWGEDAIFLDMSNPDMKLMQNLFPDSSRHLQSMVRDQDGSGNVTENCSTSEMCYVAPTSEMCYVAPSLPCCSVPNEEDSSDEMKTIMQMWRILHALNIEEDLQVEERMKIKEDLRQCLSDFDIALNEYIWEAKASNFFDDDTAVCDKQRHDVAVTINDFKQLCSALDFDTRELNNSTTTVREIVKRLQLRRAMVEPLMYQIFASDEIEMVGPETKDETPNGSSSSSMASAPTHKNGKSKGKKNKSKKKKGGGRKK